MEKTREEIKTVTVVDDVTCDSCSKSCKVGGPNGDFEYMTISANWGFYSKKDLQKWTAHLCEECVDKRLAFVNFKKEQIGLAK